MYTVGDLLKHLKQTTLFSITAEDSISEAIAYMKEKAIGAVPVKAGEELTGILTERDVLWKCDLEGDLSGVKVADIMTPGDQIISVAPGADLEECFNLMNVHSIRHLPVVQGGKQVGMISIRDLVRAIVDQQIFISSQMESYIPGRS
jgi:CBS domain-containing protein